uniref:RxLR effector protein n=1 Tax=Corethron hystrix TaxID=216773 RepID=A0A7S1BEW7_9STRA|mmetsp:Transcript_25289/g.58413  ORF Transcript_25289/g.58413 Transcript_25289/m.58413 type:complete len:119 (+) Transcript_25289:234-590(+)|eukprot:CAMPEP_0113301792 /NCGR_PEP_ID=MMETSP0010_2-20120614/2872_1 /TAXON_ID=216773 ORGANISM="Corethron hystrix, Strain 308" /NCGR_SAMPLE_ID=MMETSP0010_2 /ASSEMBLY_ACC=CAM_ASM_000155 /LENGTH=118 /DNA_ID=CAMNT_0000155471 /DNA_START=128 /DNA_END=484 /DNA_ORIENTATION=- /assembly_acc=CAM_ASM_000155
MRSQIFLAIALVCSSLSHSDGFVISSSSARRTSSLAMGVPTDLASKSKDDLIAIINENRATKKALFAEEKATLANKAAVRDVRKTIALASHALFEKHGVAMKQSEAFENKKKLGQFQR